VSTTNDSYESEARTGVRAGRASGGPARLPVRGLAAVRARQRDPDDPPARRTALAPALAGPGDETSRTRRPDGSTGHATTTGLHAGFLAPTPSGPGTTVHDELDRVAQTPVEQVAHELQRCRADQSDPPAHAALSELLADPQRARDTITRALLTCWQDLLAPHWPRVQHLLDADVAHRAQHLTDHGLTHLMQHLHPDVRYQDEAIQVDWRQPAVRQRRDVDGAGLVLMPSAFTWPQPIAVLDPPWQPTIVYPARGVAELWHRPAADPATALAAVLGPTRARLLIDLEEPDDTTRLAARYSMAPSSVSRHLQALHAAGLLSARRQQRRVLYQRTTLGTALTRATPPNGPVQDR